MIIDASHPRKIKPKVLLVDDEPRVLRSLKAVLKAKYQILTAQNAHQAREVMDGEKNIAVVISDERMPQQPGHELLIWTKQHYPNCSRIIMTDYFDATTLQSTINEAEIFRFLTKPWNWDDVKKVVENAVLLHQVHTRVPQLKPQKHITKGVCDIAVLDTMLEKKAVYQQLFTAEKLEVFFFKSVEELTKGLLLHPDIGILFVDINIGEKEAINVLEQVRNKYPDVVFIAVTEACRGAEAVTMLNQGQIFKYLVKPLTVTRLKPMLLACLHKHQQKSYGNQAIADQLSQNSHAAKPSLLWHKISQLWH